MAKIYLKKVKELGCEECYFVNKDCIKLNLMGTIPDCSCPSIIFIQVPPPEGGE